MPVEPMAARERHILCMKWGTKYGPEYVNRLYAMVRRHLSGDFNFVCLTDGGVHDNLGVNPLVRDRNALDYVIVSDGGMPFSVVERPTESGSPVLAAAIDILMEQVRGLQFERLELGMRQDGGPKPVWFSIDSTVGQAQDGDAAFASAIRTNLKRLSAAESTVLQRHAGALLTERLQRFTPELLHAV